MGTSLPHGSARGGKVQGRREGVKCVRGPLSRPLIVSTVEEEEEAELVEGKSHLFNNSLSLVFPDSDKIPSPELSPLLQPGANGRGQSQTL